MRLLQLAFVALWLEGLEGTEWPRPRSQAKRTVSNSGPEAVDVDVAIIGGGSGGIHAAIQLKDAGANVLVLEKQDQIGGHAETYVNQQTGVVNNIGVVIFHGTDVVRRYFARLGVPTITTNPFLNSGNTSTYDFSLGIFIPPLDDDGQEQHQRAIRAAVEAYSQNVLSKYGWVDQGYFLPNPVPQELCMPFADLAAKYNFTSLLPVMAQFSWYFGNQTTVPALYGVKDFGPSLLSSVFGQFILSGTGNTRSLYDAALKELGPSVLLNTNIMAVDRASNRVTLRVFQDGTFKTIRAKKLLVAIPPMPRNLMSFDLPWDERSLFNIGAFTPSHQSLIPGSNVFRATGTPEEFSFGVGFDTDQVTDVEGEDVIRKELATLAGVGAVPADAADTVTFPATAVHVPFNVRVGAADIGAGFYDKLLALQGSRNTYWTGAAWTGQNSDLVWTFNEGTIIPALKRDLGLE
jgi:hypothetical protein